MHAFRMWRIAVVSTATVCAGLAQAQQQVVTYKLNFFHEASSAAEAQLAAEALDAAIGERVRTQKQVRLFPDELPATPGSTTFKTVNIGPFSQQMLQCGDAFAEVSRASETGPNLLGGSGERYTGCVFVSKVGIRSSIVIERYTRAGGSLFGAIIGGIRNTIQGDDAQWGDKTVAKFTEIYKQRVPHALVELVETPRGIERPDDAKVKELLANAKRVGPVAVPTVPAVGLGAALNDAVEARKLLASMNLTYHSADQLEEALRRRDVPAVELFVKAAGIRADTKATSGLTAAEVSLQVGDQILAELVKQLK